MRDETSFDSLADLLRDPHHMKDAAARKAEVLDYWSRRFSRLWKARLDTDRGEITVYVKQYRPGGTGADAAEFMRERVLKDFEVTTDLETHFASFPHLTVPRALACFPEHLTVVFEESSGVNLFESIQRGAIGWPSRSVLADLELQCHRCGEWLRHLQRTHAVEETFSVDRLRDYVETRLRHLTSNPRAGFPRSLADAVRDYYRRLEDRSADLDLRMSWAHADFCPGNVLAHPSRLTVIDLAMFERGSVYQDVSHFRHHLELFLLKPIYRRRTIRRLAGAFLEGYSPEGHDVDGVLLHAFQLRHLITHYIGVLKIAGAPLHERWYNRHVIRQHRQRIARDAAALVT